MNWKKIADFFAMTRTERIGTYTLLVLMAIMVLGAVGYRSCTEADEKAYMAEEILSRAERARLMADSIKQAREDSAKVAKKRKKAKTKSKKKNETKYEDRELQEVPQY